MTAAISVGQPLASLIVHGYLHYIDITLPPNGDMTPKGTVAMPGVVVNQGDTVAIHASSAKRWDKHFSKVLYKSGEYNYLEELGARFVDCEDGFYAKVDRSSLPTGAVLGTAVVSHMTYSYITNKGALHLTDAKPLEGGPDKVRGRPGLWNYRG